MKRPTSPDGTGDKRQKKTETKENNDKNDDKNDCLMDEGDNDHNIRYQLRSGGSKDVTPVDQPTTAAEAPKQAPLVKPTKKRKGKCALGKEHRRNNAAAKKRRLQQRQALVSPQSGADQPKVECPPAVSKDDGKNSLVDKGGLAKADGKNSLLDKGGLAKADGKNSLLDKGELTTEDNLLVRFKQQSHDTHTSESEGSDAAGTFWTRLGWKFLSWISGVSQRIWLVPDTNFFMQDKAIMQAIKNKLTTKLGSAFYIGISYTVVKELDAIKNDRSNKRTVAERYLARQAIILLCQWFDNDDACVKGENPYETAYVRSKMAFPPQITNNDDQISEWCLQLRVKYGQSVVALLSEDRGFRVKANLHGLKAFSIVMLTDWLSSSSSSF